MKQNYKIFEFDNFFEKNNFTLPIGTIKQVSELSIIQNGGNLEHTQVCDELTYAISGKATIISDNNETEMKEGSIHFIKKGCKHHIVASADECFRYICIGINFNDKYDCISSLVKENKEKFFFTKDDGTIKSLSNFLLNEFYYFDANSKTMINSYLTSIFTTLFRLYNTQTRNEIKKDYNYNLSMRTFYTILKYVDREYINIKSIKEISEHLSYNEDYISHLFKEKMGITLKEYLIQKKINMAKELLISNNLKIEVISEHLNFNTVHTFGQAFKRITSMSPTEYRKINSGF